MGLKYHPLPLVIEILYLLSTVVGRVLSACAHTETHSGQVYCNGYALHAATAAAFREHGAEIAFVLLLYSDCSFSYCTLLQRGVPVHQVIYIGYTGLSGNDVHDRTVYNNSRFYAARVL